MLTCPYCESYDFDKIGLKHHLLCDCVPFDLTPTLAEEEEMRSAARASRPRPTEGPRHD